MQLMREGVNPAGGAHSASQALNLKVGDWVVVRAPGEILATLDENACLQDLPFMPQMLGYCGRKFRVRKRAHKMCDTVHATGARRMSDAVFLDGIVCDGEAFGGCEMACSIVWKEAWLRRAEDGRADGPPEAHDGLDALGWRSTRRPAADQADDEPVYVCQATKIPTATKPLSQWTLDQYIVDYRSGNAGLSAIVGGLLFLVYSQLVSSGVGLATPLRWLYNIVQ